MKAMWQFLFLVMFVVSSGAKCSPGQETFPKIDRRPMPAIYLWPKLSALPKCDPNLSDPFQVDLRSRDISSFDLRNSLKDLQYAVFDDKTEWPDANRLPGEFDYKKIMRLGKNPGPGIGSLHKKGITGRGVGVAIIDQALLTGHVEYADRLMLYEEINLRLEKSASMQAPIVTSLAAGKTVGVAPESLVYFVGAMPGNVDTKKSIFTYDFSYFAQAVERILQVNETLPPDKKIRVLCIPTSWSPGQQGSQQIAEVVKKASDTGIFVVCCDTGKLYGFKFNGLSRNSLADPNNFDSYRPARQYADIFYRKAVEKKAALDSLLVPMDARGVASATGPDDYMFIPLAGWSLTPPYIAGLYCLACQVDGQMTPEKFFTAARQTSRTIQFDHHGQKLSLAPVIDPVKLIEALTPPAAATDAGKPAAGAVQHRRLLVDDYIDKVKGGWLGQMVGVGWGGPTEFRYPGKIIPEDEMPEWDPVLVNQFLQDDLYVEMTFLRTLETYGLDVSIQQAGKDFADSQYPLWHANDAGRENLRKGISPLYSGHPHFSKHSDDIDYQIEADFSGLIAPGMPNFVIELGEKFGRLVNYGDGIYAGQFVGGMYAEAFFENDPEKIVRAGLQCIPEGSQYYECISDVLTWYKQTPDDWEKTWQLVTKKYQDDPSYRRYSCYGPEDDKDIDAKINGAYAVIGMLYGKGDPDKTVIISTRCGHDSDCNPSTAAGVLFTTFGFDKSPEHFKSRLDQEQTNFSHTPYNFRKLIEVCEKLARQAVLRNGGKIEKDSAGREVFVIPVQKPVPSKLVQSWDPEPIPAGS